MNIDMDKVSYILGQSIGGDFRRQGFEINVETFVDSFKAAFDGKPSKMAPSEMQHVMMAFQSAVQEKQQAEKSAAAETNLNEGKQFLAENAKREEVTVTESGLQYRVIKEGSGDKPSATDTVETHYEGKTLDGNIFDSSVRRGTPAAFPVNGVIKGWQEALQLMGVGAKWELFVPSDLAYGPQGMGGTIGPNAVLVFEVELLAIK